MGGFAVCLDLLGGGKVSVVLFTERWGVWSPWRERGGGGTDKTTEDLVAGLDADFAPIVVDGVMDLGFSIGAESAVETDAFHGVVQDLVVGFGRVHLGVLVDVRKMLLPFVREVVI